MAQLLPAGTHMRRCPWAAIMVLTALFAKAQVAAAANPVEIPIQFREGLLWVEVSVPQSEQQLNFLVDTGSSITAINLSTARRLGAKLGPRVAVQGVQTELTGYWQTHWIAKIGNIALPQE